MSPRFAPTRQFLTYGAYVFFTLALCFAQVSWASSPAETANSIRTDAEMTPPPTKGIRQKAFFVHWPFIENQGRTGDGALPTVFNAHKGGVGRKWIQAPAQADRVVGQVTDPSVDMTRPPPVGSRDDRGHEGESVNTLGTPRYPPTWLSENTVDAADPNRVHRLTTSAVGTAMGELDIDRDGLHDDWEQQIVDADPGDLISDVEGVAPGDDFDGDGLTNQEEFNNLTIPVDMDSDDDGWSDLHELQAGTSPTTASDVPDRNQFTVGGPGASDLNLGDAVHPLATLHHAISRINALDSRTYTLNLTAGIYSVGSGESDQPLAIEQDISIIGADNGLTILDGNDAAHWDTGITIAAGAANVNLHRLTIQGFDRGIGFDTDAACLHLENMNVQKCRTGLAICGADMLDIDLGNTILTANDTGILLAGSSNVLRNGSVTANTGDGIRVDGCGSIPYDNLIENTRIISNGRSGIRVSEGSGNRVVAATITGNNTSRQAYGGVDVFGAGTSVNQSLISGNHCYGIYADDSLSPSPVDARDNYWGDSGGPSGAGYGLGDGINENVSFVPWIGQVALAPGTFYVDNANGSDDLIHGRGAGAAAWKTLHFAIEMINSGLPGSYTLHLSSGIFGVSAGEPDQAIVLSENVNIVGAGVGSTIINGTGATAWRAGFMLTPGSQRVTISNLTVNGFGQGILVRSDGGCLNFRDAAILACDAGMALEDTCQTTVDLTGSVISGNAVGIVLTGSGNNVIQGGVISGNNGDGILIDGCSGSSDENEINGTSIFSNLGNGILVFNGSGNRVTGAIVTGNNTSRQAHGGVAAYGGCTSINDSVISGNGCYGVYADDSLSQSPVDAGDNYWGHPSGPSGVGYGTGDAVSGYVAYTPWTGIDPLGDPDLDGWPNQAEAQAGTHPDDAADRPILTALFVGGKGKNDSNLGDRDHPLATLHAAVKRVNSAANPLIHTIHLAAGVYHVANGESDEPLFLNQDLLIQGLGAVIDGGKASAWKSGLIVTSGASFLTIEGLRIQGFTDSGIDIISDGGCIDLDGIQIASCTTGLRLRGSVDVTLDLSSSVISGCENGVQIGAQSSHNKLVNGVIEKNAKHGILVGGCPGMPDHNLIQSAQVLENGQNGIVLLDGSANSVMNCMVSRNNTSGTGYGGIVVLTPCSVVNWNTIAQNHSFGLYAEDFLSAVPVDARFNWWGSDSGPSHSDLNPLGTGDPVSDHVAFSPWLDRRPSPGDIDNDGLPDRWETEQFGDITRFDGTDDADSDGLTNAQEYARGSDPNNPVWIGITAPVSTPHFTEGTTIALNGQTLNADSVTVSSNGAPVTPVKFYPASGTWHADVPLDGGQNVILATATGNQNSDTTVITVIRDTDLPTISIEDPTAGTGETSFSSVNLSGQADDDTRIQSVTWESRVSGSPTANGPALPTGAGGSWRTWAIPALPLADAAVNQIEVTATDIFAKKSKAAISIARVADITSQPGVDLSPNQPPSPADPFDLDGDGYHNDDETMCGSNPENSTASSLPDVPPNNGSGGQPNRYPTDPTDPDYHAERVRKDADGMVIDTYLLPDCVNPDDDRDGMPDGWEDNYGMNIHDPSDAAADADNDTLDNLAEYQHGTDPTKADTDGDGVNDGTEVANGTDPTTSRFPGFSITLVKDDDRSLDEDWLPAYGKVARIKAEWIGTGPAPATVTFALARTSSWPGRAINDPDPQQFETDFPTWYWDASWNEATKKSKGYYGFDFGLLTGPLASLDHCNTVDCFGQGPIIVADNDDGQTNGEYFIYLQCWDYGGRTRIVVSDPSGGYEDAIWAPKGSGPPKPGDQKRVENGIGTEWKHEIPTGLDANADQDRIIFTDPGRKEDNPGDNFSNFMEYRGFVYTIDGTLKHERLDPNRNDLFIHHIGYDAPGGVYPFAYGSAMKNIGIEVWITNGFGHDATVDDSFYVYYSSSDQETVLNEQETVSIISEYPFLADGKNTNWKTTWPKNEWELRLDGDLDNAWTPVNEWKSSGNLSFIFPYLGGKTSGTYKIRMPVPPINALIVHHHPTLISPFGVPEGEIAFNAENTLKPGPENPQGHRYWHWPVKGYSDPKSSLDHYGLAITLRKAIDNYFDQMPYMDGTTWTGNDWIQSDVAVLEPLSRCEDFADKASSGSEDLDILTYDGARYSFLAESDNGPMTTVHILPGNTKNLAWDGDHRLKKKSDWGYRGVMNPDRGNLSPFDIDNNGLVELPFATDPKSVPPASQHDDHGHGYDKARVTQFLVTHEIGHALAGLINHTDDHTCCMFRKSNNWKRDNYFSDRVRENIEVHNHERGF